MIKFNFIDKYNYIFDLLRTRKQKTENRKQKTENRKQKTENRKIM
jgi:hypothetical protein